MVLVFIMELANLIQIPRTAFLADSAFSLSILILIINKKIIIIIIMNEPSLLFSFLPFNNASVEIAKMREEGLCSSVD